MNANTGVFHVDHKRSISGATLTERRVLRLANARAAQEFSELEHQRRIQKTEYVGGYMLGFATGAGAAIVILALCLWWAPL